jgi:hypothetical protein
VNGKTGNHPGIFKIIIIWLYDFLVPGYGKNHYTEGPCPVHCPFARHEGNVVSQKEISHWGEHKAVGGEVPWCSSFFSFLIIQ